MKSFLATLSTTVLVVAFSSQGWAQDFGNEQATVPKAAQETAKFVVPAPPVTPTLPPGAFVNRQHGLTLVPEVGGFGGTVVGLKVSNVEDYGLGQSNGLEVGDVILELAGKQTQSQADLDAVFNSIAANTVGVQCKLVNVNNGQQMDFQYNLRTDAGEYQSNFGIVKLRQSKEARQNAFGQISYLPVLTGTLRARNGTETTMSGVLNGNTYTGTWQGVSDSGTFNLTKSEGMFKGRLNGNGLELILIKRD